MIEEASILFLDFIPYAVGRVAIFVLTLGQLKCESWQPMNRKLPFFETPLTKRVDGKLLVTDMGVRQAGILVFFAFFAAIAGLILQVISFFGD